MGGRWRVGAAVFALGAAVFALGQACSGEAPPATPAPEPIAAPEAPPTPPTEPVPALLMVQAQFIDGRPGPARMNIQRWDGKNWFEEVVEDPESSVFHKAVPWRDGILTISACAPCTETSKGALLKHWKKADGAWTATTLVERKWGGKFDRFRDLELGDVDGDGKDEIVLATHDMGVVTVGDEAEDGTWTFVDYDQHSDTFVHEVEIGDVDGDGKKEFYVTPSERNKASGESQPGGVMRYDFDGSRYKRTQVVHWNTTHAKEILVADLDGDGKDELYAAREAVRVKGANGLETKEPSMIVRFDQDGAKWKEVTVATLPDESMCRFLLAGDVNHDRKKDIVAAGKDTGLWMLDRKPDGTFTPVLIDGDSGGFEHATDLADFDFDGKPEIYAASEKSADRPELRQLRKYYYNGTTWEKTVIAGIPPKRFTWNIQDAKL
jgi:FG-GAP-like repeat